MPDPASTIQISPPGHTPPVTAGDFLLCRRKGLVSLLIRLFTRSEWSHAAYCRNQTEVIEALTRGVAVNPLAEYHNIRCAVVHTRLALRDAVQATVFAESCVGKRYGFLTDVGIVVRIITRHNITCGLDGTEICSGLVAQAMVRGWANFPKDPGSMDPQDLADYYGGKHA